MPDPQVGETIKAVIVLNEEAKVTAEDIKQWCKDKRVEFKIITEKELGIHHGR